MAGNLETAVEACASRMVVLSDSRIVDRDLASLGRATTDAKRRYVFTDHRPLNDRPLTICTIRSLILNRLSGAHVEQEYVTPASCRQPRSYRKLEDWIAARAARAPCGISVDPTVPARCRR